MPTILTNRKAVEFGSSLKNAASHASLEILKSFGLASVVSAVAVSLILLSSSLFGGPAASNTVQGSVDAAFMPLIGP